MKRDTDIRKGNKVIPSKTITEITLKMKIIQWIRYILTMEIQGGKHYGSTTQPYSDELKSYA